MHAGIGDLHLGGAAARGGDQLRRPARVDHRDDGVDRHPLPARRRPTGGGALHRGPQPRRALLVGVVAERSELAPAGRPPQQHPLPDRDAPEPVRHRQREHPGGGQEVCQVGRHHPVIVPDGPAATESPVTPEHNEPRPAHFRREAATGAPAGSQIVIATPPSGAGAAVIVPPSRWTSPPASASPSPAPVGRRPIPSIQLTRHERHRVVLGCQSRAAVPDRDQGRPGPGCREKTNGGRAPAPAARCRPARPAPAAAAADPSPPTPRHPATRGPAARRPRRTAAARPAPSPRPASSGPPAQSRVHCSAPVAARSSSSDTSRSMRAASAWIRPPTSACSARRSTRRPAPAPVR